MIPRMTAYCPKCERLQPMDQGTMHVKETILVDRIEHDSHGVRRIVGKQQLIAHTLAMLSCRHHVTVVRPA